MLFKNGKIYDADFNLISADFRVKAGKFAEISPRDSASTDLKADPDEEVIDLDGKIVYPGMIDQHTHGALGKDAMDGEAESIELISRHLASHGVTSFLVTTMTMGEEHLLKVFNNMPQTTTGANVLGVHMEGPFINVSKKGAQNADYVRVATAQEVNKYLELVDVKVIDIAPEIEGNLDFIKAMHTKINIQVGHCLATYEDTTAAIKLGATGLCHGFNAMPGIHHREPGPIIAAMRMGAYTEIISDGLHINPNVVYAAYKLFGPERMIIVSDAIKTTGQKDGEYEFGGQPIVLTNGVARVKATGALAGGSSNIWQEVKNLVAWGIPVKDALRMGSLTPAEYLHVSDHKGSIAPGKDADFIVSNADFDIFDVYIMGKKFS